MNDPRSRRRGVLGVVAIVATSLSLTGVHLASEPQQALATAIGGVDFSGDPTFDSASIAGPATNNLTWLSYPGSRFFLNPNLTLNPTSPNSGITTLLPLNEGAYLGGSIPFYLITDTKLRAAGGAPTAATAVSSSWYPYQYTYAASFPSPAGSTLSGSDSYADVNGTMIRTLHVVPGGSPADVVMTGSIPASGSASWDPTSKALKVEGPTWTYAIKFDQSDPAGHTIPVALDEVPAISGSTWTFTKSANTTIDLNISVGFGVGSGSIGTAVANAVSSLTGPVSTTLAATKSVMDALLREVPVPASYSIPYVNTMGVGAAADAPVSPAQVKTSYYRAWTFELEQIENSFGALNGNFNYPQVATGKESMLNDFSYQPMASEAAWDSLMAMQDLAYIPSKASTAFAALAGILSQVNVAGDGSLSGERLPTRFAQTAWTLYQQTGDIATLTAIYPELKALLTFLEAHPYWSDEQSTDEKDLEYVASWLNDVVFMEKIAPIVGHSSDVAGWTAAANTELANLHAWFFSDPAALHQFYFANSGTHYSSSRPVDGPDSLLSVLSAPGLSSTDRARALSYFEQHFDSTIGGEGFGGSRFPDDDFISHGLLNTSVGRWGNEFTAAVLRGEVFAGNFSEGTHPGNGLAMTEGVTPSDFSAAGVISQVWLLNGVSIEPGVPTAITADPGTARFRSGFEAGDPDPTSIGAVSPTGGVHGVTGICCGLTGPETAENNGAVSSGGQAIVYSGMTVPGADYAYTKVFDLSAAPLLISASTNLEYSIFPQTGATTTSPVAGSNSSFVAVDVVFSDGKVLRNLGALDQFGRIVHPATQGGHLNPDQWNRVISNIGAVAAGKSVVQIGVGYDQPSSPGGGYRGFIDDISVQ